MLSQLNSSMISDPRLGMMFQQFISHMSSPQGWGSVVPPQHHNPFQPAAQDWGAFHPVVAAPVSAATQSAAPISAAAYAVPPGDPPFSFVPQPALSLHGSNYAAVVDLPQFTPVTKSPGKRKRPDETPSKTPTRSSNRTRTPRKFIEI